MSLDEDYVRTVFASDYFASQHPTAKKLLAGEITRSLTKQRPFARMLVSSMQPGVTVRTEAGFILPDLTPMTVDAMRVVRVLTKIARGLFFVGTGGRRLPTNRKVYVSPPLNGHQFRKIDDLLINRMTRRSKWITVGDGGAFAFRGAIQQGEDAITAAWLFVFYERIAFFIDTNERDGQGKIIPSGTW